MMRLASILLKACRGINICESQGYVLVHICVLLRMCYVHCVLAHVYIVPSPYNSLYSRLRSLLLNECALVEADGTSPTAAKWQLLEMSVLPKQTWRLSTGAALGHAQL